MEPRILYNLQGTAHSGKRGNPNVVLVNESGLYSLIFASKTEFAKEFKHWVTSVVLPSLRKHGYYICPEAHERAAREKRHRRSVHHARSRRHQPDGR